MWVLSFVGIVRVAVVLFAVGVGVCGVALFSFGVGWCFWQVVIAVFSVSFGFCNCKHFSVSLSFLFRKGLGLVTFINFLLLSGKVSGSLSFRFWYCHVGFAFQCLFMFQGRFFSGKGCFWYRCVCFCRVWFRGRKGWQYHRSMCFFGVQNSLGGAVVWVCVLVALVS